MKKWLRTLMPPLLRDSLTMMRYRLRKKRSHSGSIRETFTDFYRTNKWGSSESVSGQGSNLELCQSAIRGLNEVIATYAITSLLDLPCGDFHWMQHVNLSGVQYLGGDIVEELIARNHAQYTRDNVQFQVLDLLDDPLPAADLVLVRDCLVHFSYAHVHAALQNLVDSGSKYLLATTFPEQRLNYDIVTGDWRPLNLTRAPFHFPPPLMLIAEDYPPAYKQSFRGKSLGMWEVAGLGEKKGK